MTRKPLENSSTRTWSHARCVLAEDLEETERQPSSISKDEEYTDMTEQPHVETVVGFTLDDVPPTGDSTSMENSTSSVPANRLITGANDVAHEADDAWIVIMGMTGAGKSTFISMLIEEEVTIGHGLHSTTHELKIYRCSGIFKKTVWLIDTPGFDDTDKSDAKILQEIATFLAKLYTQSIHLSGSIYLHRITDPKMSGSAIKNLEVFKLLCGKTSFPIVRLVTTRWNELQQGSAEFLEGISREEQLCTNDKFWKPMIESGSIVLRLEQLDLASTRLIIESILQHDCKMGLAIQVDMVERQLNLSSTSAGLFLDQEYRKVKRKYEIELIEVRESKKAALQERDEDAIVLLLAEERGFLDKTEGIDRDQEEMNANFLQLDARKARELALKPGAVSNVVYGEVSIRNTEDAATSLEPLSAMNESTLDTSKRKAVRSDPAPPPRKAPKDTEGATKTRSTYVPSDPLQKGTLRDKIPQRSRRNTAERVKHFVQDFIWSPPPW